MFFPSILKKFYFCYDMMKAIIEEAERLEAPVILEIHPDEIAFWTLKSFKVLYDLFR
ncbi:hypothetical protein EfmJHP36_10370 [Enterococcus faecium]|nr:hypothetical protein EfmJHP36_10370 [Enterococcus faecium]